jgi:hypothetical protein
MRAFGKPLLWLHGEVRTPPLSRAARLEAGWLLRRLQLGESLELPHSRAMPRSVIEACRRRLRDYDLRSGEGR